MRVRRRRRARIVALSGLDGAGKSTQAEAVRLQLAAAGVDAVVIWTKIASNPSLDVVARAVKRVVLREAVPPRPPPLPDGTPVRRAPDAGTRLRQRSGVITHAWTLVVAVANTRWHRQVARAPHQVVICDRYVLDSAAHLRYRYGHGRRYRLQTAVLRWWSPRPLRAYFLDVAPDAALARKREDYDHGQLTLVRSLYLQSLDRVGRSRPRVLDGERPAEDITADIATEVLAALGPSDDQQ